MAEVNWGDLGAGASGQPEHQPIATDEDGHGPVPDGEAVGYACRCGSRSCRLDTALKAAWRSGVRLAAQAWPSPPPPRRELDPQQVRQLLSTSVPR